MLLTPGRLTALVLATLVVVGAPPKLEAAECTTRSDTVCRIDCAEGSLSLACPPRTKKCRGRCRTGQDRERVAQCRSGSGSKCFISCDRGTQSLVCTKTAERCRGRCVDWTIEELASRRPTSPDTGARLAAFQPDPTLSPPAPDPARLYFQELVADVYWASGVQERPSAVAVELWEALDDVERGKKKSSVVEEELGGDQVELHMGLRPRHVTRFRAGLASFVDRLRLDESARQQFDREVQALTRSLLFEDATSDDPPEPLSLTVKNRNCEGAQTFRVSSETRWIRFRGDATFSGLGPGQSATAEVGFDLTGLEPDRHRGEIFVDCLTCPPNCRVDRSRLDVYVEVVEPVD